MSTETSTSTPSTLRRWGGQLGQIAAIVLVVLAAKGALAEPFYVPSASMEPTLLIGDALVASKYPYGYSAASLPIHVSIPDTKRIFGELPKRGDVVVFRWPGDPSQTWVKRVIGLPGDRIALHNGRVYINGDGVGLKQDGDGEMKMGDGAIMHATRYIETLPGGRTHTIFKTTSRGAFDNLDEVTVPAGRIFVMGDNRDHSADSRVPLAQGGVGLLPVENLVGRVDALVGSWDMTTRYKPIWEWPSGLRLTRFFTAVH
jgi:signal peptidase I